MKIVLIGSGQVATHLGYALVQAHHEVLQVISKTQHNAEELARKLGATSTDQLQNANANAEIYIIAVNDDAIADVVQVLQRPAGTLLLHTSGSTSIDALYKTGEDQTGVLYPLQTFSKQKKITFDHIPIAIESTTEDGKKRINELAGSLSDNVFYCDSAQRMKLHIAAVFACNFTNYFYRIAEDLLKEEGFSLDLIRPLLYETTEKAMQFSPREVQTGPAIRGDQKTIEKHLMALSEQPLRKELYALLTQHIQEDRT